MTIPSDIPVDIYQWAADFWDANLETEQVEMVARAYMAGQGAGPDVPEEAAAGLTRQQANVLNFIKTFTGSNGFSPSYTEIMAHVGLSSRARVCEVINRLEERGVVRRLSGHARSLALTGRA